MNYVSKPNTREKWRPDSVKRFPNEKKNKKKKNDDFFSFC